MRARPESDPGLAPVGPLRRHPARRENLVRGAAALTSVRPLSSPIDTLEDRVARLRVGVQEVHERKTAGLRSSGLSRGGRRPLGRKGKPRGASGASRRLRRSGRATDFRREQSLEAGRSEREASASRFPPTAGRHGCPQGRSPLFGRGMLRRDALGALSTPSTRPRKKRCHRRLAAVCVPAPGLGKPGVSGLSRLHALEGNETPWEGVRPRGGQPTVVRALKTAEAYERQSRSGFVRSMTGRTREDPKARRKGRGGAPNQ
jgi:hypothetical protein